MPIKKLIKKFFQSDEGAIAVIAGLCMPLIIGMATISIEISRQNYIESKLAFAVDAAAVAGARYDITKCQENATKIFDANFPPGTLGMYPKPVVVYDPNTQTVTVTVKDNLPTKFASVMGIKSLAAHAQSQVKREFGGLELAMVLDTTGSMSSNNKIGGLIAAANSLVDIIYEGQNTRDNTAIAIVPFVTTINIGTNNTTWLSDPATVATFPASQPWQGCIKVNSTKEFEDETFDTPPTKTNPDGTKSLWPTYFVESTIPNPDDCVARDNDWHMTTKLGVKRKCPAAALPAGTEKFEVWTSVSGVNVGPNRSCSLPIMPLRNNATDLKAYINKLLPVNGGGTMGNLGLVWGGRVLSEFWNGSWVVKQADGVSITGEPIKPYSEPTNTKAILIMTDGESQWYDGPNAPNADPTSYGTGPNDRWKAGKLGSTSMSNFKTKIDQKILRLCTTLKKQGVEIFTVTFRVTDPAVNKIYQDCATTPGHFSAASDNAGILSVFNSIAKQLKRLRITA